MKRGAFLKHIRDYAELSQRMRKSYAEQAHALLQSYLRRLAESDLSDAEKSHEEDWALSVVQREYGTADREFSLSPDA